MGKFVVKETSTGIKFDLKAGNGEVIATSEVYTTKDACLNGIASVKKNSVVAEIEDQTVDGFEKKKNPKFEVYVDKKGEFRFRLTATNGQIILTSGAMDIRRIGSILASLRGEPEMSKMIEYTVFAGYQLSYPDEKIVRLTMEECADADEKGLCSGMIVPKDCAQLVNFDEQQMQKKAKS